MTTAADGGSTNLQGRIQRGLGWSMLNSLALRFGNLAVGIALARLLAPEEFGVFAIALTVQAVLVTLADLGMSVDLVRADNPEQRAPTVATLSLASSVLLALLMSVTAGPVAGLLGAPHAANVIALLSCTLVISGAGVVPYAKLQRDFQQRKLFATSLADFAVGTSLTIVLVLLGLGPIALAVGRVAAQSAATFLQFLLARVRPHFGFNRTIARSALSFGLPLAVANLFSWALLNIDNVAVSRIAGTTALGLYVLAFNVSSWPMNAIGQAVRSVSLAGFSRTSKQEGNEDLRTGLALTWAVSVPVGVLLAALAHPLVVLLYGEEWGASAAVLAALGLFGGLRVVLDLISTYLLARGATRPVLYVQILWFVSLVPAIVFATRWRGIAGAGWAHLAVGLVLIAPAYGVVLARMGVSLRPLLGVMWVPAVAGLPTWYATQLVVGALDSPLLGLFAGGAAGLLVYIAICYGWVQPFLPERLRRPRTRASRIIDHAQPKGVS